MILSRFSLFEKRRVLCAGDETVKGQLHLLVSFYCSPVVAAQSYSLCLLVNVAVFFEKTRANQNTESWRPVWTLFLTKTPLRKKLSTESTMIHCIVHRHIHVNIMGR